MRCNRFGDTATPTRLLARLLYGAPADMVVDLIAREEPPLGSVHSPPVAQDLQQLWRKHDIAVYASFALFDSDNHSFAIDIGDFQADSFRDAQPRRVAGGQNRAMLDIPHTTQKLQNFFRTGDNGQLLGFLGAWNDFRQAPILMKRDFVKETQSCYGEDDRAWSELPFVG
jgi:hypothetical protein